MRPRDEAELRPEMCSSLPFRALIACALLAFPAGCGDGEGGAKRPGFDTRPTYVVGVDRDFPPYAFADSQGRIGGFAVDLTRAVADVMGFEIELRAGDYDEIVAALERGEIDIIPHLAPSAELEERFAFTLSHIEVEDAIFVREEETALFTEAHIHDRPTLVWQPSSVEEYLEGGNITGEVLPESSIAETLRRLATGEGDCALVPHLTGLRLSRELQLRNLRIAGPPIKSYSRSLSFAVRLEDRELLDQLDEGLTLVTTTRRYPDLYNQWFGVQEVSASMRMLLRWLPYILILLLLLIVAAIAWSWSLRQTVARRTAALRQSEERLQGILDNAPMMIYMRDAEGRYQLVNSRFEELAGSPRDEVREITGSHLFKPAEAAELRAHDLRVLETGLVDECEEVLDTADGPRTFMSVRFPLHHADGSVNAVCAINVDVTEQKRAEEAKQKLEAQIQQTQKLESLGMLAGGVAHDFSNLLMGILGNTGLALQELAADSPARDRVLDVERAGERAAELCQKMLAYSGKGQFFVEPLDLSALVADMTQLLHASISRKARLEQDIAAGLPAFEADASQIRQVVMNLITNASEALGEKGGTITVRTGAMSCDEAYLERTYLAERREAGPYVFLEVRDDGQGMDAETRERIFDPFFSTKFTGRGLGLAATLGIVRGHRGALEVESAPGQGTVFRVLFPASTTAPMQEVQEAMEVR
ncbi:MAG: transporter substrate-binding domain-containing protein [bacterium]|nr:transporter substrate-binding domain-containing protein [bacterium]